MTDPLVYSAHRLATLRRIDDERLYLRLVVRRHNTWRAYRPVAGAVSELETLGVADGRAILALVRSGLVEAVDRATGDVVRSATAYVAGPVGALGRLQLTAAGRRTLDDWREFA